MTQTRLDLTELKCPLPALKTRKALKALAPGDVLEVPCTDTRAVIDIPNLTGKPATNSRSPGAPSTASYS